MLYEVGMVGVVDMGEGRFRIASPSQGWLPKKDVRVGERIEAERWIGPLRKPLFAYRASTAAGSWQPMFVKPAYVVVHRPRAVDWLVIPEGAEEEKIALHWYHAGCPVACTMAVYFSWCARGHGLIWGEALDMIGLAPDAWAEGQFCLVPLDADKPDPVAGEEHNGRAKIGYTTLEVALASSPYAEGKKCPFAIMIASGYEERSDGVSVIVYRGVWGPSFDVRPFGGRKKR